jgi:tRNA pseudouridine55 synthase
VGHAGTLDPFATGLLVVLVGGATRLARFVEREAKRYTADVTFGVATDTDDSTGAVIGERVPASWPDEAGIRVALQALEGTWLQRPPAYSARKVAGRRAYKIARAGGVPELEPREVTVSSIELMRWAPPVATLDTVVSAGTYVRAIARDLGERLGGVAHCSALRRVSIGSFRVDDAIPLERLAGPVPLIAPLALLGGMHRRELSEAEYRDTLHGRPVAVDAGEQGERGEAALVHEERLIAVAERVEEEWRPRVVLEAA